MNEKRWEAYRYGDGKYEWSVRESPGGGRAEYFPSIMTWLCEGQAVAIANFLNDVAGYDWHNRYPEWSDE